MSTSDSNSFRLHVLGAPDLRAPDGRRIASVLSQPKRLGLLTYLALASAPVSRASLVALFWPESDEARARNALSQAVFYLRRSLDERVLVNVEGDRLWAPPEHLWCDAREPLSGNGDEDRLCELLEGWNADDSHALQDWLDAQRRRLRAKATPRSGVEATGVPNTPPDDNVPTVSVLASPATLASRRAVPSRWARLLMPLLALGALTAPVGFLVTMARTDGRSPSVGVEPLESLAVLMPQISSALGAPEIDPGSVHAEILASLPQVAELRIVSAASAGSLQELRTQLAALGVETSEFPRWILEVSVRVTGDEARAVGLLHQSPSFDVPGRTSFDVTYGGAEAALLDAPREVARRVAQMVTDVLGQNDSDGSVAPSRARQRR
jgi:hypothetical protein